MGTAAGAPPVEHCRGLRRLRGTTYGPHNQTEDVKMVFCGIVQAQRPEFFLNMCIFSNKILIEYLGKYLPSFPGINMSEV
jgi:hypothetical protein